jgi:hypothetical protein
MVSSRRQNGLLTESLEEMTENEWLTCTNSSSMLRFLRAKLSARQLRLFICALCRQSWHLFVDNRSRQAVVIGERFADRVASKKNLETALANAKAATRIFQSRFQRVSEEDEAFQLAWDAAEAARIAQKAVEADVWLAALQVAGNWATSERTGSYLFVREICGNPFHLISLNPGWLTPTVTGLARAAYEERNLPSGELDPVRFAVLADALQDAGCDNEDILAHCRQPGEHWRGCWLLDSITGRK